MTLTRNYLCNQIRVMVTTKAPPSFDLTSLVFNLICDNETAGHDPIRLVSSNLTCLLWGNDLQGFLFFLQCVNELYYLCIINLLLQSWWVIGRVQLSLHTFLQETCYQSFGIRRGTKLSKQNFGAIIMFCSFGTRAAGRFTAGTSLLTTLIGHFSSIAS